MHWRTLFLILLLLTLMGCGSSTKGTQLTAFQNIPPVTPTASSQKASAQPKYAQIGPLQLQAALMSLADTTNARTAEAAMIVEQIGTPQARLTAARMMVYDISANVEIASGPYPGIAMLDLIVLTSLRRMVWESYWCRNLDQKQNPLWNIFAKWKKSYGKMRPKS